MTTECILGIATGGRSNRSRGLGMNKLLYPFSGKNLLEHIIERAKRQHPSQRIDNVIFTMRRCGDPDVERYLKEFCRKNIYAHIAYGDHQGLGGAYYSVADYAQQKRLPGEMIMTPGDTLVEDYLPLIGGDEIKIGVVKYDPQSWKRRKRDGEYARADIFRIPEQARPRFVELYKHIIDDRPEGSIDRFKDIKTNYAFDILKGEFPCKNVYLGDVAEINIVEHAKEIELFLKRHEIKKKE